MGGWKSNWIIGIGNSAADGVRLETVRGTDRQVKNYLLSLAKEDRANDFEAWDHGTEKLSEIEELRIFRNPVNGVMNTGFYAYNSFADYHIDYTAAPELPAKELRG